MVLLEEEKAPDAEVLDLRNDFISSFTAGLSTASSLQGMPPGAVTFNKLSEQ